MSTIWTRAFPFQRPTTASIAGALLVSLAAAASSLADLKRPPLTIATWDVSTASDSVFAMPPKPKRPRWRTTFGSERRDRPKRGNARFDIDADVVLIQGVRNIGALRRVLTSRRWRLILSPDYVQAAPRLGRLPADLRSYDIARYEAISRKPVTAIAVRYQRGVRVRGVKPLSALKTTSNGEPSSNGSRSVAVRLFFKGRQVWLASVPVMAPCSSQIEDCLAETRKTWQRQLPSQAVSLIMGLSLRTEVVAPQSSDAAPSCEASLIHFADRTFKMNRLSTKAIKHKDLGCFRSVTVP